MPDYGLPQGGNHFASHGMVTGSSAMTPATGGAANVKGPWATITASASAHSSGFWLYWRPESTANFLVDIALGTGEVIVENLLVAGDAGQVFLPLNVPAGATLQARVQSTAASAVLRLGAVLLPRAPGLPSGFDVCRSFGPNTASTRGTQFDPGAVAHTKGSWVEFSGQGFGMLQDSKALLLATVNAGTAAIATWLLDVGLSAASGTPPTTGILLPNLHLHCRAAAAGRTLPVHHGPFPVNLSRLRNLWIRAQCNITTAASRTADAAVYLFA